MAPTQPQRKKQKKQQEGSRLLPCPVCHRSFPHYFIHDHVNICLDTPQTISVHRDRVTAAPVSPIARDCVSRACELENERATEEGVVVERQNYAAGVRGGCGDAATEESKKLQRIPQSTGFSPMAEGFAERAKTFESMPGMMWRENETCIENPTEELGVVEQSCAVGVRGDCEHAVTKESKNLQRIHQSTGFSAMAEGFAAGVKTFESMPSMVGPEDEIFSGNPPRGESTRELGVDCQASSTLWRLRDVSTKPGPGFKFVQMSFGRQWDAKTRRFAGDVGQELPAWMYDLSRDLASDAQKHTPVYAPGSIFAPDVALVNFYPVKSEELGVVGLGGHQDLDDFCEMPVVSVSVGDNMTFFYRRLPPLSRRKNGVLVVVDESAAKYCKDGDIAHNREKKITLESGDVLVFGGESRMVYHGTCNVQPGTRPPGLHMIPGRLNFTFRQCNTTT